MQEKSKSSSYSGGSGGRMMRHPLASIFGHSRTILAAIIMAGAYPPAAQAHVKWFADNADFTAAPLAPSGMLFSLDFQMLLLLSCLAMFVVLAIESRLPQAVLPTMPAPRATILLRAGTGLYLAGLACYFHAAPVTLAPELKSGAGWLPPLQLVLALLLAHRQAAVPAAAGLLAMYVYSAADYGIFHMLDYLFIPGIACFLVGDSAGAKYRTAAARVLRASTGFSLMWAAVEKWLHPDWSIEVLGSILPRLAATFGPEFVVAGAGFVEFFLAFLLIFGRLAARWAAGVLLALLMAAVPLAGLLDAIGHLPLIAILIIFVASDNPLAITQAAATGAGRSVGRMLLFALCIPVLMLAYRSAAPAAHDSTAIAGLWPLATVLMASLAIPWPCWPHAALHGSPAASGNHFQKNRRRKPCDSIL